MLSINSGFIKLRLFIRVGVMLSTAISFQAAALPNDREQPIHIDADSAERNETLGTTVYSGAVKMNQGSLRILADIVTVYSSDVGVNKIIATGLPADLQQRPSLDKEIVIARGNTITYKLVDEKIVIVDNAFLEQDGSTTKAKRIDYDVINATAKTSGNERVKMVIQPQKTTASESQ